MTNTIYFNWAWHDGELVFPNSRIPKDKVSSITLSRPYRQGKRKFKIKRYYIRNLFFKNKKKSHPVVIQHEYLNSYYVKSKISLYVVGEKFPYTVSDSNYKKMKIFYQNTIDQFEEQSLISPTGRDT